MKIVILAAGFGSRLWPLSTSEKPKQFQPLLNGESLLQYTYGQLRQLVPAEDLYIVTLDGLQSFIYEQLPGVTADHIFLVPERRNTFAHTLWSLNALGDDQPVLFKSVDHYLPDPKAVSASILEAMKHYDAKKSAITMLCTKVESYYPHYGYMAVDQSGHILEFAEKPSKEVFQQLQAKGQVYRNPLIFMGTKAAFLRTLQNIQTPWARSGEQLLLAANEAERRQIFPTVPIQDLAPLFETSKDLLANVIEYEFLDVGKYDALYQLNKKDQNGNVVIGRAIVDDDCRGNFIVNQLSEPLVVLGTQDSVVVQTAHGSLAAPLAKANSIGDVYKQQIL